MIKAIRIDDALWAPARKLRRHDWQVSITDLLEDGRLGQDGDHMLRVRADADGVACTILDEHAAERVTFTVRAARLRPHVDEYLAIIRRVHAEEHESKHSPRMAAFDMAKKVVHDGAAKTLAHDMPGLAHDQETYRRLFSLFFSLFVDVTHVPGAQAHRRHGGA